MAKAGTIKEVQYNIEGGVAGTPWAILGLIPPSLENGISYAIAATWENTADETFQGHIALQLTDPDGGVTAIAAVSGQDVSVVALGEQEVVFAPFDLAIDGVYAVAFTLTEAGVATIFDTETAQAASVSTTPAPDTTTTIDINTLITPLISIMIVMMMMKMMTSTMGQIE